MGNGIVIRDYQEDDSKALVPMIARVWGYDEYFKNKDNGFLMTEAYLDLSLADQNFALVAEDNGEAKGIIIAQAFNKKRKNMLKHFFKSVEVFFKVNSLNDKFGILKLAIWLLQGYRKLDRMTREKFGAEITFFILDGSERGKGLGKKLFDEAVLFFKDNSVDKFYLYTDNSCSYGFYDHLGMKKIAETTKSFKPYEKEDMTLYLYEGIVEDILGKMA